MFAGPSAADVTTVLLPSEFGPSLPAASLTSPFSLRPHEVQTNRATNTTRRAATTGQRIVNNWPTPRFPDTYYFACCAPLVKWPRRNLRLISHPQYRAAQVTASPAGAIEANTWSQNSIFMSRWMLMTAQASLSSGTVVR